MPVCLTHLPPLHILSTRLESTKKSQIVSNLQARGCSLVLNPHNASLFLGDVLGSKRAGLELKSLGIESEDVTTTPDDKVGLPENGRIVKVIKLQWYKKSVLEDVELNIEDFIVYKGIYIPKSTPASTPSKPAPNSQTTTIVSRKRSPSPTIEEDARRRREAIMYRAMQDNMDLRKSERTPRNVKWANRSKGTSSSKPKPLLVSQQSTEEHDDEEAALKLIPEPPDWVKNNEVYACLRSTPMNPPSENKPFIDALFKIRLNRILQSDEIGVRAYSTAIAAISAYPYPIFSTAQIQSLPGCEKKIAILWYEFHHSNPKGQLTILNEIENSEHYKTLELFYNIWGCGAHGARNFWLKGFRDLDDLVEHHWNSLTRVQQIGVKYYYEFENKIPRSEVVKIRDAIISVARTILPGVEGAIVGGYRRGKEESADVDLLITHPRVSKSRQVEELLVPLVDKLEELGLVTHVLTIHQPSRHVATESGVVFPKRSHHNFDGIPKVLCVWQQPYNDDEMEVDSNNPNKRKKNPNPHRRVDILFPPPRCAGSTLTSWSGANTFERDLRRYVNKRFFWKFSSEGLTNRATAQRIPIGDETGKFIGVLNDDDTVDDDFDKRERKEDGEWVGWEIEEKKLFKKMDLVWREAKERCTG